MAVAIMLRHQQSLLSPTLALLVALPLVSGVVALSRHDSFEIPTEHVDRVLSVRGTEGCSCMVQCRLNALCMGVTVAPAPSGGGFECRFSSTFLLVSGLEQSAETDIVTYRRTCDGVTYQCVGGAGSYIFDLTPSNFTTAKESCPPGSQLASLSSVDVYNAVAFYLTLHHPTHEFWVDIERTLPEDIWTWGDGTVETAAPGHRPWAIDTGVPRPESVSDLYARMRPDIDFLLDDKKGHVLYGFICQPIM